MNFTSKIVVAISSFKVQRIAVAIACAALLMAGGTITGVAVTPAEAARCGGLNQKACPAIRKGPVCNRWLRKVKKVCRPCGGLNQRACAVVAKGRVCKPGLRRKKGRCVPRGNDNAALRARAKKLTRMNKPHIAALASVRKCLNQPGRKKNFVRAIKKRDTNRAAQVANQCISVDTKRKLRARPLGVTEGDDDKFFNTLSVGVGGTGSFIIGGALDAGIVFDFNRWWHVRLYTNREFIFGYGFNVGADVVVGLGRDPSRRGQWRHTAVVFGGKYLYGGGVAVEFERFKFDGFSVSGGVGVATEIATIHKAVTRIWGYPCRKVDVRVTNNTGSKIKIVDLDYYDSQKQKWRSEPTPNAVIANGRVWRKTRSLERIFLEQTKVKIKYRKPKTTGSGKWWGSVSKESGEQVCNVGSQFNVVLR